MWLAIRILIGLMLCAPALLATTAQAQDRETSVYAGADTCAKIKAFLRNFPETRYRARAEAKKTTLCVRAPTTPATSARTSAPAAAERPILSAEVNDALSTLDDARLASFLRRGWSPNALLDSESNTALHLLMGVCERNKTHDKSRLYTVARLLIESGANKSARNKWGDTPLSIARSPRYCGPDHPVIALLE